MVDYWQGHYANILGHNPPEITARLIESLQADYGLQTGLPEEQEIAYAEPAGADDRRRSRSVSPPPARWRPCTR